MKTLTKQALACAVAASMYAPLAAWATNGMNLEGYGPIATGMGGASMAYDNGTAAVMNNPATLGLMGDGNRFDIAVGNLRPNVKAEMGPYSATSSANSFIMPAVGWMKKQSQMTYGVGVFSQGGMGTEYAADSFVAQGSGDKVRSEVGVGRIIFPLAYNVSSNFVVAGSLDYVWAGMDIKMALPGSAVGGLVDMSNTNTAGWGPLFPTLGGMDWARFDFSNSSDYTGQAKSTGFAAKIGVAYKVDDKLSFGATYHSKTSLGDLKGSATLSAGNAGGPAAATFSGDIAVRDFQWPALFGVGASYKAMDNLMLAADIKRINWGSVMQSFKMTFTDTAHGDLAVELPQEWKNQTVISLGGAYMVDNAWTIRAGFNHASNPVPDTYLNYLFPATVTTHVTFGVGYDINKASDVNFSLAYVPEVSNTSDATGITSKHSQMNWQLMYSYLF